MDEITKVMLKDHAKIDSLVLKLDQAIQENDPLAVSILSQLKWLFEKHFFIEEKVIFTVYLKSNDKESEEILGLMKDHKIIHMILSRISDLIKNNKKMEILELRTLLRNHVDIENKSFYPRLDKELSSADKDLILVRMEDVRID